jgi:SAM-dependent methyltransferase
MSIAAPTQDWFKSTVGRYVQAREKPLFDQAVSDLFGFNALQIGSMPVDLLANSRMPNRYKAVANEAGSRVNGKYRAHVVCSDDFLPFAEMSLDLLLLPHRLEFSDRPHQTLREAARVMMPDGHLIISGFNPISAWGACAFIKKLFYKQLSYPWHGRFIGLNRLKDWLALLGFEVVAVRRCCHVPPIENRAWHKRLIFMDKFGRHACPSLAGVYFIVAKKRVAGMTPIKPNWKQSGAANLMTVRPKSTGRPSKSRNKLNRLCRKTLEKTP